MPPKSDGSSRSALPESLNTSTWFQQQQYWELQAQQLKSKMLKVLLPEVQPSARGKRKTSLSQQRSSPTPSDRRRMSVPVEKKDMKKKQTAKSNKKSSTKCLVSSRRSEPYSPMSPQSQAALDAIHYLEREKEKEKEERKDSIILSSLALVGRLSSSPSSSPPSSSSLSSSDGDRKLRILSEEAMLDSQAARRSIMSIAAILN